MVVVNRLQNVEPAPRYRRLEDIEISKLQEYRLLPKGKRQLRAHAIDIPIMTVPDSHLHLKFLPDALIHAVEASGIPISLPEPTYVFTGLEHVNLLGFSEVRKSALSADEAIDRTLQRLFVDIHDWFIRNVKEHGPEYFASSNASWENFFILFRWSENIRLSYTFLSEEWDDDEDENDNDFKSDSYYYDYLKVFFFLLQNRGRDDSYWNMDAEEEAYTLFADRYGWEKALS